jgi:hypothetical protein
VVIKLFSSGAVDWVKRYRNTGQDSFGGIAPRAGGGYIVTGSYLAGGFLGGDGWLLLLKTNGDVLWEKLFGDVVMPRPPFSLARDGGAAVLPTPDGGFVVAGTSETVMPIASINLWVLRFDGTPAIQWQKWFGGPADSCAGSIALTPDRGVMVAGTSSLFGPSPQAFVLRLEEDGRTGCACGTNDSASLLWDPTPTTPFRLLGTASVSCLSVPSNEARTPVTGEQTICPPQ